MNETVEERICRLTAKADALLHQGDALGVAGKRAEGRRTLRECRRVRREVIDLRKVLAERGQR